ncbi:MAG: S1C family serine protease [Halobacteriota archaeon]
MSNRVSRRQFLAGTTGALTALAGCTGWSNRYGGVGRQSDGGPQQATPEPTATESPSSTQTTAPTRSSASSPYARVYEQTIPSVVLVRVYDGTGVQGEGSGFVYDGRHVVTNHHVVDGATTVRIRFLEGEWREVTVDGTDIYSDLAVLGVPDRPGYATPIPLVDDAPPVGTEVVALGAPLSLDASATAGIVSGLQRTLPSATGFTISDGVQTDAPVNPGNSGGPLVTLDGDVVGVINSGGGDNIGFAISAALVERVVPALIEAGEYAHPYLGVTFQNVTPLVATANGLSDARGIIVVDVGSGGPSDGVLRESDGTTIAEGEEVPVGGDVIVGVDDGPVQTRDELLSYLALETDPGEAVTFTVIRDGQEQTVEVTLGVRPDPA